MSLQPFSSLQLELLKTFALNPSEEDLIFIRKVLAAYFSSKSQELTAEDLEEWLAKSKIEIVSPEETELIPIVEEPLSKYHNTIISKSSKSALAKAIAKEEPLILE